MLNLRSLGKLLLFTLGIILFAGLSSPGQSVTGSISGTVTDRNGGVVPGASITITFLQTGTTRSDVSNDEGRFAFAALQPGVYTVKIEHQGFQTLLRQNTVLSANENLALGEVALETGNVNETVTIDGRGAVVELESSDLTARLTSDQIDLISTKGRDITSLLRLIPGTTNENDVESVGEGFGTDLPFISGQRGRSTVPSVDGLNAGEPSGSNKLSMTINQDAVAEVKILRNNYAAEYGNNGGAIINLVTKGGGKEYRGTAYYFLRNEALNASPFFSNMAGLAKPLYRHNIWGFNYGGPLPLLRFGETDKMFLKNKAFFFFSYEQPHTITPTNPIFVTVPTALERAGDFSQSFNNSNQLIVVNDPLTGLAFPGNRVPQERWNQSTATFLRVFPLPNVPAGSRSPTNAIYNYVTQKSVDVPKRSILVRFDVKPTNNDSVFWKWQWFKSDNVGFGTSGWPSGDQNRWGIDSHYLYKDGGWSTTWSHVLSTSIVNEFNLGMRHDSEGFVPDDSSLSALLRSTLNYSAPQLFPTNNELGTIPKVTNFTGTAGTPALINWLDRWGEIGNDYVKPSFSDNLSVLYGKHSLKFGIYYERLLNAEASGSSWAGVLSFTNSTSNGWNTAAGNTGHPYANALLGDFQSYTETQFRPHTNIEQDMLQWYAQDQWKFDRRLSLTYGVRFGWHTPFYQKDGVGSSFDPSLWNPANPPRFYIPVCTLSGWTPSTPTACPTANQFAADPSSPGTLLNRNLVRSYVPGSGSSLNGLQLAKDPNTPKGYRVFSRLIDVEPRVGFAYDLTGKAKTVLRAMLGVYHTPRAGGGTTGDLTGNPPEQRSWTINNGNIANLETLAASVISNSLTFPFGAIRGLEKQTHTPEIYNWSMGVQQDLGWGTVIEASYVGSRGRWLGEQRNINGTPDSARFVNCSIVPAGVPCHPENRDPAVALSSTNPTTGALNTDFLRPYVGYGDINYVTFSGNSRYDSLQVQVNRRYTKGFQYGVAYTFSKSTDVTSDDRDGLVFATGTAFGGRDNDRFNHSFSDFDQRQVFAVNYIWDVPFFSKARSGFLRNLLGGWIVSGTTSFATGKPKDVTVSYSSTAANVGPGQTCPAGSILGAIITSGSNAGLFPCTPITDFTGGSTNALPFVTCDPNKVGGANGDGTPLFLNVDCFSRPTKFGDIGDPVRNLTRRPNIFNTDIALFKNFKWGEKRSIQLRWETYNVFNKSNFSDIDSDLTFGVVQLQSNPRDVNGNALKCSTTAVPTANVCSAGFQQTNARFGAAIAARSPRVMQASIRINF